MTAFTGDIQILLYTEEENFSVCRDFYQTLLGQSTFRLGRGIQECQIASSEEAVSPL